MVIKKPKQATGLCDLEPEGWGLKIGGMATFFALSGSKLSSSYASSNSKERSTNGRKRPNRDMGGANNQALGATSLASLQKPQSAKPRARFSVRL